MHVLLLKFYKNLDKQNYFDMDNITSVINIIIIAISHNLVLPSP